MNNLRKEGNFFIHIAPKILKLISQKSSPSIVRRHTYSLDYTTQTDIDVENLILKELKKSFPNDTILSEEAFKEEKTVFEKRTWLIDPICGTTNMARGIASFVTNIALAKENKVIAACVIDHARNEFIWSIGNNRLHINSGTFEAKEIDKGVLIDVDFGSIFKAGEEIKEKYTRFIANLIKNTNYQFISQNTSLSSAYVALGKLDAFFCIKIYPWDVAASTFFIQQAGGMVTDLTGEAWMLHHSTVLGARNRIVHKKLLKIYFES